MSLQPLNLQGAKTAPYTTGAPSASTNRGKVDSQLHADRQTDDWSHWRTGPASTERTGQRPSQVPILRMPGSLPTDPPMAASTTGAPAPEPTPAWKQFVTRLPDDLEAVATEVARKNGMVAQLSQGGHTILASLGQSEKQAVQHRARYIFQHMAGDVRCREEYLTCMDDWDAIHSKEIVPIVLTTGPSAQPSSSTTTGPSAQPSSSTATGNGQDAQGAAEGKDDTAKMHKDWLLTADMTVGTRIRFKSLEGGWAYFNGCTAVICKVVKNMINDADGAVKPAWVKLKVYIDEPDGYTGPRREVTANHTSARAHIGDPVAAPCFKPEHSPVPVPPKLADNIKKDNPTGAATSSVTTPVSPAPAATPIVKSPPTGKPAPRQADTASPALVPEALTPDQYQPTGVPVRVFKHAATQTVQTDSAAQNPSTGCQTAEAVDFMTSSPTSADVPQALDTDLLDLQHNDTPLASGLTGMAGATGARELLSEVTFPMDTQWLNDVPTGVQRATISKTIYDQIKREQLAITEHAAEIGRLMAWLEFKTGPAAPVGAGVQTDPAVQLPVRFYIGEPVVATDADPPTGPATGDSAASPSPVH